MRKNPSHKPPIQNIWKTYQKSYELYHSGLHWTNLLIAIGDWFFELSAFIIATYFYAGLASRNGAVSRPRKRNRNI